MEAKHEILLEQMLEELRAQTAALQSIQRRLDELERGMSGATDVAKPSITASDR